MSGKSNKRVVVTIDDEHVSAIESVAEELRAAGLQVSNVLPVGGIISGEVPQEKLDTLRKIGGVLDIEPDEEMRAI